MHNFNICRYPEFTQGSPGYKTGAITTTLQSRVKFYTTDKNNLENKPGKQNYKTNFHHFNIKLCPDLNQGSPVYETGALTAKPQHTYNCRQWTEIILTNKLRKHNYKPHLHKFNICRYPDLDKGSPVHKTGAITTTLQSPVKTYTTDKNNLDK